MNLKIVLSIVATILVLIVLAAFIPNRERFLRQGSPTPTPTPAKTQTSSDPLNTTYTVEGSSVTLTNGKHEEQIPGSTTKITTTAWGEVRSGDLTANSQEDAALILIQDPGGSGTFYYVAAAINENGQYTGTNAILLGDRIAIQNLEINKGVIEVNYADRAEGEPMTVEPSVAVTKRFIVEDNVLKEVSP